MGPELIIDDPGLDRRLAEQGDPAAMVRLVRRARREETADRQEVLASARRAAEAGHPGGMLHYALLLEESDHPDRDRAARWRRRAAEAGLPEACHQLGSSLARRSGDDAQAVPWLERAAAAGHEKAGLQLAALLWSTPGGRLPEQIDIDAGAAWYRRMLARPSARVLRHRTSMLGRLLDAAILAEFGGRLTREDPMGRLAGPPYWTVRAVDGRRVVIDFVPSWKPSDWIGRQLDELLAGGWEVVLLQDASEPFVVDDARCSVIGIDADHPRPATLIRGVGGRLGDGGE